MNAQQASYQIPLNPYNNGFNLNQEQIKSLVCLNETLRVDNLALNNRLIEANNALSIARAQIHEVTHVYGPNRKVVAIALASTALNIAIGFGDYKILLLFPLVTVCLIKVISDKLELSERVQAHARTFQVFSVFVPAIALGIAFLMQMQDFSRIGPAVSVCMFIVFAKEVLLSMWIASALK